MLRFFRKTREPPSAVVFWNRIRNCLLEVCRTLCNKVMATSGAGRFPDSKAREAVREGYCFRALFAAGNDNDDRTFIRYGYE